MVIFPFTLDRLLMPVHSFHPALKLNHRNQPMSSVTQRQFMHNKMFREEE